MNLQELTERLHRIRDSVIKDDRPEIRGMIAKVSHLVSVEEVADGEGTRTRTTSRRKTS